MSTSNIAHWLSVATLDSNGSQADFVVDDRHAVRVVANRWDPIVVGDAVLVIVDLEVQFPEARMRCSSNTSHSSMDRR